MKRLARAIERNLQHLNSNEPNNDAEIVGDAVICFGNQVGGGERRPVHDAVYQPLRHVF